jgi:Amt family ammonium transporter
MKGLWKRLGLVIAGLALPVVGLFAQAATSNAAPVWTPNSGDTSWVLTSSALVLLMTVPALALFYGGMVRRKNVLSTIYYSLAAAIIVSLLWVVGQYSLIFATTPGVADAAKVHGVAEWFGNMSKAMNSFLANGAHPNAGTIPESVYSMFQLMFAIITVALISGSIVERMSFLGWVVFAVLWSMIVYTPLAHWVWNPEGILAHMGALDFAGGLVVHTSSGVTALVLAIVLGPRIGHKQEPTSPANIAYVFIGAALLWVGWFGFNAGSAVAANVLAGSAFVVTNTAAAMAALVWLLLEWIFLKKPTVVGASTGVVAGLVAITPASGYVDIGGALVIGACVSLISFTFMSIFRKKFRYDDALDVFSVHGLGGMFGALATGLFANPIINSTGKGAFYGNPGQFLTQLISVGFAIAIAVVGTLVCILLTQLITLGNMRVKPQAEIEGLDLSQHGEQLESK